MDHERSDQKRTGENVVLDEVRDSDSPNYRKQPTSTAKNDVIKRIREGGRTLFTVAMIFVVLGTLVLVIGLNVFRVSLISVVGESMSPTFHSGDTLILHQSSAVQKNDIMVFRIPNGWIADNTDANRKVIKRIVAVPGDTLSINNGVFKVNSNQVYAFSDPTQCASGPKSYSYKLSQKEVFVLGDNAEVSLDSRKMFCSGKLDTMYVPKDNVVAYGSVSAVF